MDLNALTMTTFNINRHYPFYILSQPTSYVDLNPVKCWIRGPAAKFLFAVKFCWTYHKQQYGCCYGDRPKQQGPHSQYQHPDGRESGDKYISQQPSHAWAACAPTTEWSDAKCPGAEWLHNCQVKKPSLKRSLFNSVCYACFRLNSQIFVCLSV